MYLRLLPELSSRILFISPPLMNEMKRDDRTSRAFSYSRPSSYRVTMVFRERNLAQARRSSCRRGVQSRTTFRASSMRPNLRAEPNLLSKCHANKWGSYDQGDYCGSHRTLEHKWVTAGADIRFLTGQHVSTRMAKRAWPCRVCGYIIGDKHWQISVHQLKAASYGDIRVTMVTGVFVAEEARLCNRQKEGR